MKRVLVIVALLAAEFAIGLPAVAKAGDANVMGFQSWKASRIEEAKQLVERLGNGDHDGDESSRKRSTKNAANSRHQALAKGARTDQKLQQAHINLEIAQEFTVNDYFVLYLSQFKQKESFVEAARKLSHEEAAELMMSYQKRLSSSDQDGVTASLSGISTIK